MPTQLVLGTAGHIDHGKTALVKAMTGIDTDRLPQEKQRGITIDLGFASLDLGDLRLGIVDVPGHERFVRNMLAGAAGIDLALLVIAADDSVMPQTREHLAILELLHVAHGVIALTKADMAEPSWLELVEEEVRELVGGTFLEDAPIVRTSARDGTGIDALKTALADVARAVAPRRVDAPFRMAVDRSFVLQGLGSVVTGTVWSGEAAVGDEIEWLPASKRVRVRSLQSHSQDADRVARGQRAAFNLQGVHHTEIRRGHELAMPGYLKPSHRLTVRLTVLPTGSRAVRHRSRVRLHLGTQEVMASVRLLQGAAVEPGERRCAQLICVEPVVATGGQPFVIRSESPLWTIGGGVVLQPVAPRISRRNAAAIARVEHLDDDDDHTRAATAIYFCGTEPWTTLDLCRDADLVPAGADSAISDLTSRGVLIELPLGPRGMVCIHHEYLAELCERVLGVVSRLHEASPLEQAVARRRLIGELAYVRDDVVLAVVDHLIAASRLVGDEHAVALPSFEPALSGAQSRLHEQVIEAYRKGRFSPPGAAEIAKTAAAKREDVRPVLELAASQGHLIHLGGGLYLHRECEQELQQRITEQLRDDRSMTMSEIRDVLETSRKFAVPICEYLDRIGLTKRRGDVRVLNPNRAGSGSGILPGADR
ncbi:MAG: selenocysteine-specific translation elongation factor [Phycisphaerales bacterium]|nr:selenocysteine-specific translation elongation factor [Phycisphaerales bacterium]